MYIYTYLFESCPQISIWMLSIGLPLTMYFGNRFQSMRFPKCTCVWKISPDNHQTSGWISMTMDTSGTLRESLSRMLWSRGGLSSNSSWKTARSHALNHHSKPTRFLVNQYPLKEVFKSYESSWKSNNENQGFWQERCPVEVEGLQWACGLRLVGTCYIEIGKGSPEPREAYPCWLHVTTWDFFWTSTGPHWAFWIEGQTSSLQLRLDSIALRCSASEVQVKIENAGRYLPLVWNYGFPVFTTIVIQMCKSLLIRPLCSRMTCANHDEKYNKFQSVAWANLLLKTFALLLTWYGLSHCPAIGLWCLLGNLWIWTGSDIKMTWIGSIDKIFLGPMVGATSTEDETGNCFD